MTGLESEVIISEKMCIYKRWVSIANLCNVDMQVIHFCAGSVRSIFSTDKAKMQDKAKIYREKGLWLLKWKPKLNKLVKVNW